MLGYILTFLYTCHSPNSVTISGYNFNVLSPHVGRRRHAAHDDIVALDGVVPAEVVQDH